MGQLDPGRHPVSGKRVGKTVYGETQREVREKRDQERQRPTSSPSQLTLKVALDLWLGARKTRVDASAAVCYEQDLRPVKECLGQRRLSDRTAADVTALYRWMGEKGYSASKQRRAGSRLRQALASVSGWAFFRAT